MKPDNAAIPRWPCLWAFLAIGLYAPPLRAGSFATDSPLTLSWDNDVFVSASDAIRRDSTGAMADYGGGAGLSSARVTGISGAAADLGDFGLRVSAAAWYDARGVSRSRGARSGVLFADPPDGGAYFAAQTADRKSGDVDLLEAFIHGASTIGDDQRISFRLGRHVLIWGESLYFPANGIAGGQAPLDATRRQPAPSYSTDQEFAPVGQASLSWQPASGVAVEAYYQFEYRANLSDPGYEDGYGSSTYGTGLALDPQSRRAALVSIGRGAPIYFAAAPDRSPDSAGQYGVALKQRLGDVDIGAYALSFSAKAPVLYFLLPSAGAPAAEGGRSGTYSLLYPGNIALYGVSVAGAVGDAGYGAEISARRNMPLVTAAIVVPDRDSVRLDRLYPAGDTLQAQFSWNYATGPLPGVLDGAVWTGEIAGNALLATTANPMRLMPGRTPVAAAFRTIFEPRFLQAAPGIDLTTPVGFGYRLFGRSAVDPTMDAGQGDISIGVTATLDQAWRGSITFAHSVGKPVTTTSQYYAFDPARVAQGYGDFLSITIERKF
jgi:hypothetical protein